MWNCIKNHPEWKTLAESEQPGQNLFILKRSMNGTWQYIFYKPTVEEIEANFKPKGKWWECMEAYETRMEPVFDRKLNKVKDLLKLLNEALCERALSSTAKARPAGRRIPI